MAAEIPHQHPGRNQVSAGLRFLGLRESAVSSGSWWRPPSLACGHITAISASVISGRSSQLCQDVAIASRLHLSDTR